MSALPSFTCICLQKRLVLRHREEVQREQQDALERLVEQYDCKASVILGSGCIVSNGSAFGQAEGFAAVFLGTLETEPRASTHLSSWTSEKNREKSKDAETICHMYKKYGRMVPQKLKGDFSFVLFDPAQERVLAAVSPHSQVPLLQARGADGCLLITTAPAHLLPEGSHSVLAIPPGFMKYGWSSDPQQYSAPLPVTPQRGASTPSARAHAARLAFSGAFDEEATEEPQDSQASVQTSGPSFAESEGGEPQSPAPKKTRRGKRGGRNQKLRAESLKRIPADGLSRTSTDFATLPSGTPSTSSFSSRADERSWWRTNTPRQSLELGSFPSGSLPTSSLLDCQGSTPNSFRRFSMSATAPAFVPGQSGLFTRQSIPVVRAKTTALSFPERDQAKKSFGDEAFLVAPSRVSTDMPPESSMVSPFSGNSFNRAPGKGTPQAGKADAAWEDTPESISSPLTFDSQELRTETPSSSRESWTVFGRGSDMMRSATESSVDRQSGIWKNQQAPKPLRVATERQGSRKDEESIAGDSPKGGSPGGSPTKPPKIPRNAFRQILKAIIPKRSSQVDLWAEAGVDPSAQRNWAKSSSHGNLVGLNAGFQGLGFGSGELPAAPFEAAHKVTPREDTARESLGRLHLNQEGLTPESLKFIETSDTVVPPPTAAQWFARKTRNMFGKSKSCTDLHQIDRQPTFLTVETEVK